MRPPSLSYPAPHATTPDRPVFRSVVFRWIWQVYVERLTPAGRWLLWTTAAVAVFGASSLDIQAYVLFCYLTGLWLVAFAGMLLARPRVTLAARHAERVCAGETLPVEAELTQHGRAALGDVTVVPHRLPPSVRPVPEGGAPLPPLRRGETARARLGLRCERRGVYTLSGFRVESGFPFGLLLATRLFAEERPLVVYPRFDPLARLRLESGRRYQPGGVALASVVGDAFEYLGNREYREGDSIRDIDWRATARLQRPIVREYREEYFLRAAVVLDTHVPRGAPAEQRAAFERAVSLAAAASDFMARQEYIVDLFAAGPVLYHLTAGRSLAYLDQILDILACVEENPAEPFEVLEPEILESLARITTVICVFLDWSETRRAFAERLRAQGAGVKVVVVRDGPCALDPSADAARFGGIPVVSRAEYERGIEEL
jgi:uncharacterized protein (DUF58 family)